MRLFSMVDERGFHAQPSLNAAKETSALFVHGLALGSGRGTKSESLSKTLRFSRKVCNARKKDLKLLVIAMF